MKKAPKILFAVLAFAVSAGAAWGAGVSVTLKAGQFWPSDSVFSEVYNSGMVFGGEIAVPIAGGLHLWAGAEYFGKSGLLTLSEEVTKVRIIPLFLGLRYHFGKSAVRPYLGAAAAYFLFKEENPIGSVSESGLGFLGQAGLMIKIGGPFALDLFGSYRACTLKTNEPDPVEAKIGGFTAGVGFVFRF
ncbi:MAG TPA: OmpW family outer membrane protein [Candidatus Latescibacteria bacterium]|nr:OmpW family outer membrane protein [Candidatus Latescibacterota bacterium]